MLNFKSIKNIDITQYIFMFLGVILCLKKGGFFTYDCIIYMICMLILGVTYVHNNKAKNIKSEFKNNKKQLIIISLFGLLAISYSLPVIFHKTTYINDAVFEMIRYLTLVPIFLISNFKSINLIIIFGVIQSILGIDGIANRYLKKILSYFNSGYLSKDLDRLSGTIQYANTAAIIILISLIFLIFKFKETIKNNVNNKIKTYGYFSLMSLLMISVLLTKSRMVTFLMFISLCIIFFKENRFMKISLISILGLSVLASNNITNLISVNKSNIYFTLVCYLVLSIIIIKNLIKYIDKINNFKINNSCILNNRKNIIKIGIVFVLGILFIILLSKNNNKIILDGNIKISREVYNLNKDNLIEINYNLEKDSQVIIKLFEEDKNFNKKEIYNNQINNNILSNDIKYNYVNEDINNIRKVIVEFENKKGTTIINNIKINNKNLKLNYILLPSEFIFRIKDIFNGSTTIRDRIEYNKDAIKLWNKSKIIGLGGEAFRHNYKYVQELKYSSTEVHNSFVQILLESGILGFLCIMSIVIIAISSKCNMYIKLSYVMLIIHSIFDLNFSYMICLVIFAILTKLIVIKENVQEK